MIKFIEQLKCRIKIIKARKWYMCNTPMHWLCVKDVNGGRKCPFAKENKNE